MDDQVAVWERQLRKHGFRITEQRELILRAISHLPHPTRESILSWTQQQAPDLNRTTVYRTLAMLEEVNLIEHTHVGSGAPSYHLADQEAHIHLVCQRCGGVTSVPQSVADSLNARVQGACGFQVNITHTALSGLCESCLAK